MGNPLPLNLSQECRKADKILKEFVDPVNGLDRVIPLTVLRRAKGFAIFSIFRVGFVLTARAGSGIVIAKLPDGSWSAPSALGIGGIGGGFSAGAEVTDFIVVLNSRAAVKSFMATGSMQLGGNLSLAVGPLGRSAEASGALSSGGGVAAMFSYSRSQGLFGGVSLEGTVLVDRSDANGKAYQRAASAKQILSGSVEMPSFALGVIGTIERLSLTGAMAHAAKADEIEPGAGRDSWSMDEQDEWGSSGRNRANGNGSRAGESSTGLEEYFSKAEIDSRQRTASRGHRSPASVSSTRPPPLSKDQGKDPFANSEEDEDPAYDLDRDNATRNAGTYGFSSAGGGSVTNSPSASKGTPDQRQRSGSRSSRVSGYFDDLVSSRESRAYSPINGKRPTMGHRKSSSTFSLPKFGKTKTPPPFGSRKTPPVNSDALLNRFPEDFSAHRGHGAESGEDDLGYDMRDASPGPASHERAAFGSPDYESPSLHPASDARPLPASRSSSSYLNGGLKKTTAAEAILAASRSNAPPPSAAVRTGSGARAADAFGDLWESERSQRGANGSRFAGLDELGRELQSGNSSVSRGSAKRLSSYGASATPPIISSYSRYDRPSSASPKHSFRTNSGGPSKSALLQRDAWAGFDPSSSEDEAGSAAYNAFSSSKQPSRVSSTTPQGTRRLGSPVTGINGTGGTLSPASGTQTPSNTTNSQASAAAMTLAAAASLPAVGRVAAAFDFAGQEADDLSFNRGDVITVLRKTESTNDWWLGRNESTAKVGSFPANFTEEL